jgi:hypothetical protein
MNTLSIVWAILVGVCMPLVICKTLVVLLAIRKHFNEMFDSRHLFYIDGYRFGQFIWSIIIFMVLSIGVCSHVIKRYFMNPLNEPTTVITAMMILPGMYLAIWVHNTKTKFTK